MIRRGAVLLCSRLLWPEEMGTSSVFHLLALFKDLVEAMKA